MPINSSRPPDGDHSDPRHSPRSRFPEARFKPGSFSLRFELIMLSIPVIWGMNFAVMKGAYAYFDPLAFTALRFGISVLTLYGALRLLGVSLSVERKDLPSLIGLGFISNTIYQGLFVLGLARTRAGNGGLLMASTPVFAYFVGLLLKRERFSRRILAGILTSATGVSAVVLFGTKEVALGADWRGDLMILSAAVCWGWYTGSANRLIVKYGALKVTYWLMLAGTIMMLPPLIPSLAGQDWQGIPLRGWFGFAYSTFLSIVYGYIAWSYGIQHVGVSRTAVYSNVTPLVALLGGWILLGERPVPAQVAGAALILAGVFLVRSKAPGPANRGT